MYIQVEVNTSLADLKPYVFDTAMGSQMRQRKKSSMINSTDNLKILEYQRAGGPRVRERQVY